jgi:hypothetical protein
MDTDIESMSIARRENYMVQSSKENTCALGQRSGSWLTIAFFVNFRKNKIKYKIYKKK